MARQQRSNSSSNWHLASIQVKAFKSFSRPANFQIRSSGLVGVVGPNGCGKSNLLEAVCFACGCSPAVLRGCRTLKDVTSIDAGPQLPEVKLQLAHGGRPGSSHLLEASLTAEGARVFRVDGRLKSGTQVKDFLRGLGIVVDTTTVIQQASITRLTDSNNPATLANLVAAASGLKSWNQETTAACQEVARTRRALKDIQANIAHVQSAAAADETAVEAASAAARLDAELEQLLERLAAGLLQQQASLNCQVAAAQQQEQELQVASAAASEKLQQLAAQKQQLVTQQAQAMASLEAAAAASSCSLAGDIAVAETTLASLQAAAAAAATQAAELHSCKEQLQQHDNRAGQLRTLLKRKIDAAAQARRSLQALQAASSAADGLQQQVLEMQKQVATAAAALAQQQAAADQREEQLCQATGRAAGFEQQLRTLQPTAAVGASAVATAAADCGINEETAGSVGAAAATARTAAAAAAGHSQQLAVLQQQLLQLQTDQELAETSLTPRHIAAVLSACRTSSSGSSTGCSARLLHQCFTLKDATRPQAIAQMLLPLSVIAGPAVLQVLVVNSMQNANQLLAAAAAATGAGQGTTHGSGSGSSSGGKLRIWPLEQLRPNNMLKAQHAAQQALGGERVVLPLDLLQYDKAFEPAMLRAFGGFVIAADDATAAELVQRFWLSSVTLQGIVSRKGSMSGGWTGSSGAHGRFTWSCKLQHDSMAAQAVATEQQLVRALEQQQQLEQQSSSATAALAVVEQRQELLQELQLQQAQVAASWQLLQQEQRCLAEQQQRHSSLQQRLRQCKAALQGSEQGTGGSSSKQAAAALEQQLQEDAQKAAAAADEAQQQLQAAEEEVEQLSVRLETLELQLNSTLNDQQQQEQLHQQEQQLQQLRQQQQQQQVATAELDQQLQQLQDHAQELEWLLQQQQKQQRALLLQQQQAEAKAAEAAAGLACCKQELKQLVKDFGAHNAVYGLATAGAAGQQHAAAGAAAGTVAVEEAGAAEGADAQAAAASAAAAPSAKEVQQMLRQAKRLQQEATQLQVPELPAAHKELCASRVAQVAQFKQQAEALQATATALEQHVAECTEQVHAANDAVFEDIAAGFSELCSSLLPSLELQLVRAGQEAHEGLQFRFRRLEDSGSSAPASTSGAAAAAADNDNGQWHTSLGQLSGGQQTLVSLAMLLAVARSGNGSSVFLLDEIDAALDEHNQARASALLRQLAHAADSSGCQILCVTHNAAFQSVCDTFVQVVRGPNGSSMPTAAVGEGVAEDDDDGKIAGATKGKGGTALKAKASGSSSKKARTGGGGAAAGGVLDRSAGTTAVKAAAKTRSSCCCPCRGGSAKKVRFDTES